MNLDVTKQFFADFCDANPMAAHLLMNEMLNNPTGGHLVAMPKLIESNDIGKYWRETQSVAKKFILKPREAA